MDTMDGEREKTLPRYYVAVEVLSPEHSIVLQPETFPSSHLVPSSFGNKVQRTSGWLYKAETEADLTRLLK